MFPLGLRRVNRANVCSLLRVPYLSRSERWDFSLPRVTTHVPANFRRGGRPIFQFRFSSFEFLFSNFHFLFSIFQFRFFIFRQRGPQLAGRQILQALEAADQLGAS